MHDNDLKIFKILAIIALCIWFSLFLARKIDLTTADLGRHIQNGQVIVSAPWAEKLAVLKTNYYSYTEPDFSFVNHHWGSGVLFFGIFKLIGFTGVSVFYVLLGVLAFAVYLILAIKRGGWALSFGIGVLLAPLMASRGEVRPEIFTYLFCGIFFFILSEHFKKYWWVLPTVMLLWVNLHIGFIFGIFILGVFGLAELVKLFLKKENIFWQMFKTGLLAVVAACVNPFGVRGFLYPLNIFKKYGYVLVENQSIGFLENLGFTSMQNFGLYKIFFIFGVLSFLAVAIFKKLPENFWAENFIMLTFGILGFWGIRHFPSFAFFALPVLASNLSAFKMNREFVFLITMFMVFIGLIRGAEQIDYRKNILGFGFLPGVNWSAEFFKENKIQGPVFNNYDIGGYLIYHFYPQKVFVDNRPEAYSVDFFEKIYKSMQQDEEVWKKISGQYQFNAIYFSHRDYTPWGQQFLITRVKDSGWAVVYYDAFAIVMVKRSEQNRAVVEKYEISKTFFK